MVLVRGDLPEHAALSQCSHCRNVNNENKAKREKRGRERERERELTCWESSGIRCARCPLRGYFHLLTPAVLCLRANFSPVEGQERRNAFDPRRLNPPKKEKVRAGSDRKSLPLHQCVQSRRRSIIHSCAVQKRAELTD